MRSNGIFAAALIALTVSNSGYVSAGPNICARAAPFLPTALPAGVVTGPGVKARPEESVFPCIWIPKGRDVADIFCGAGQEAYPQSAWCVNVVPGAESPCFGVSPPYTQMPDAALGVVTTPPTLQQDGTTLICVNITNHSMHDTRYFQLYAQ
jgi:hypothetical protein